MIRQIPLNQIRASGLNPRRHFDQDQLNDLATSIAAQGVLQNLVVRPADQDFKGAATAYEIISGERRWRALGLLVEDGSASYDTPVPCRVVECDDLTALQLALAENLARADMAPLEEAEAFQALLKAGATKAQIAASIGRTPRHIELRLRLVTALTDEAKAALEDGIITAEHARVLTAASPETQRDAVTRLRQDGDITAAGLRRQIHNADRLIPVSVAFFARDAYRGEIRSDGDEEYFLDCDLFRVLQRAAVDIRAKKLCDAGGQAFVLVCDSHVGKYFRHWEYETRPAPGTDTGTVIEIGHDWQVTVHERQAPKAKAPPAQPAEPKPAEPAAPATKAHCAHARQRKTEALQRAIADSPKAAMRMVCLALLGAHSVTRIHGRSGNVEGDDAELEPAVAERLADLVAPIGRGVAPTIEVNKRGARVHAWDDTWHVDAWYALAKMSDLAVADLFSHLVATHSASYVTGDPQLGDHPLTQIIATDLALAGHEADAGLTLRREDLNGLRKSTLIQLAGDIAPGSQVADMKAAELADFLVTMAPRNYVLPSLRFGDQRPTEAYLVGPSHPWWIHGDDAPHQLDIEEALAAKAAAER